MKKLVLAALLAGVSASAQAAVVISFTGTSDVDGATFTGSITIDTDALGPNLVTAPNTLYKGTSILTLTLDGAPALAGTPSVSVLYNNATNQNPLVDPAGDYGYGASIGQQNDDGTTDGSYFTLYNDDANSTPSTPDFGSMLLPDFRAVPNTYFGYSSGGVTQYGYVTITGYAVTGAVPEPASWAMMVGGFGLVGGAMRRRQKVSFASA